MKADLQKAIGFGGNNSPLTDPKLVTYINLKLAALGCPTLSTADALEFRDLTESLLARHRETERLLSDYQAPVDWRIQQFLDEYLHETGVPVRLPGQTFVLDRHGIARALQKLNPELRAALKKAGHITRDPREKERKKPGQPGARKRFQFSKR